MIEHNSHLQPRRDDDDQAPNSHGSICRRAARLGRERQRLVPDVAQLASRHCGAVSYQAQFWERVGWRLFPRRHLDAPEMEGARDVLVATVKVELSFVDRLRALWSGRLEVVVKTTTQHCVGTNRCASTISVRPPAWLDRKPEGPRTAWLGA